MIKITISNPSQKLMKNMAGLFERFSAAITAAANETRSFMEDAARADIAASGKFGTRWTAGLHVTLTQTQKNMVLSMTHDIPFADIFETGGTITGHPLLWLPISGTDAEGVAPRDYSGGLVSSRYPRRNGVRPLLFSLSDKLPKYFGIESVTIPKKWHMDDIINSASANFRAAFQANFRG